MEKQHEVVGGSMPARYGRLILAIALGVIVLSGCGTPAPKAPSANGKDVSNGGTIKGTQCKLVANPSVTSSSQCANSTFAGLDLRRANFGYAHLAGSTFKGVKLQGAQFVGADLTGVKFNKSTLAEIQKDSKTRKTLPTLTGTPPTSFAQANLTNAQLTNTQAVNVDFSWATMTGTNLTGTNLTWARLYAVNTAALVGANLVGATHMPYQPVASGVSYSCALNSRGNVYCWGGNSVGQLGNNKKTGISTPVLVSGVAGQGVLNSIVSITAGSGKGHSCALNTAGNVYCWGHNTFGQLGNNSTAKTLTPVQVVGIGGKGVLSSITAISGGNDFSCALSTSGNVYCWGHNRVGQLGDGTFTEQSLSPVQVVGVGGRGTLDKIAAISSGGHSCAQNTVGNVYCWGYNSYGELGNNTTKQSSTPVQVVGVGGVGSLGNVVAPAAGQLISCSLNTAGSVYCWGQNSVGQLGNNTATGRGAAVGSPTPVEVVGVGGTGSLKSVRAIAASGGDVDNACSVNSTGSVYCWGQNGSGQLGNNTKPDSPTPVPVVGVGGAGVLNNIAAITVGARHTCAVRVPDGGVYCWGGNPNGQLGNNSKANSLAPVQVVGLRGKGDLKLRG